MGISLRKGENTSLSKQAAGLREVLIGLGWDVRATTGAEFDLDASAFLLDASGKVGRDEHFVFYNNKRSPCASVESTGDNRTGAGDGADETVRVTLDRVPADVKRVTVVVSIHDGAERKQSFGQVQNAFVDVRDAATGADLARFDLTEDFSTETAVIFGEVYRHNDEWKFRAVGQGFSGGLKSVLTHFGISL
jgi:tellurium resistance protein TerD